MAILKDTAKTGSLTGGAGRDFLFGLAGDDTLNGGAGDDVLLGGLSYDRAVYSGVFSGYRLSSGDSGAVIQVMGGQGRDLLFGIEVINSKMQRFEFWRQAQTLNSSMPSFGSARPLSSVRGPLQRLVYRMVDSPLSGAQISRTVPNPASSRSASFLTVREVAVRSRSIPTP